jgi:hypothetical protein
MRMVPIFWSPARPIDMYFSGKTKVDSHVVKGWVLPTELRILMEVGSEGRLLVQMEVF